MVDAAENSVLELLRAIRADVAALRDGQVELGRRMTGVERAVRAERRELLANDEDLASLRAEVERLRLRLDRVDTRLGLID